MRFFLRALRVTLSSFRLCPVIFSLIFFGHSGARRFSVKIFVLTKPYALSKYILFLILMKP